MYRTAEEIHRDHIRTIARHRKERAASVVAYAVPATPTLKGLDPHVLYVWRAGHWRLVAFVRHSYTKKRMLKWRAKYKINRHEIVRIKSLWEAQRNGPPTDDPIPSVVSRNIRKLDRAQVSSAELRVVQHAIIRGTPDMPRCSHGKGTRHHCKKKGTWYVGYQSHAAARQLVLNRCTTHAWQTSALPRTASNVIRVQRSTLN